MQRFLANRIHIGPNICEYTNRVSVMTMDKYSIIILKNTVRLWQQRIAKED